MYMIVTNDEAEEIVQMDVVGAEAVAEILGKSVSTIWRNTSTGKWSHLDKYKAVIDEYGTEELCNERFEKWQDGLADYHREYRRRRKENGRIKTCV